MRRSSSLNGRRLGIETMESRIALTASPIFPMVDAPPESDAVEVGSPEAGSDVGEDLEPEIPDSVPSGAGDPDIDNGG